LAKKPRGQQKIDSSRTEEIQQALIREHYLSGNPSGNFDDATQQALRRYQAANGWQSKTVPDSRALIKLGLGPDHEHLLNPESAMTMPSQTPHNAQYSAPTSGPASQDKNQQ
jgi:peptidoglycan hydrolase-like protein with peptidoglycan-binding domain